MYSVAAVPVARTSSSGGKAALPLAAICCLGTLCFLIAATIVLALIPIYLPNKNVRTTTLATITTATSSDNVVEQNGFTELFVQFQAPATAVTGKTGRITNLNTVGPALGLTNGGTVIAGQAQTTIQRRKRSVLNRRRKRAVVVIFTFQVTPTFPSPCDTACQNTTLLNYLMPIINKNYTGVSITIESGNGNFTNSYNLFFIGTLTSAPVGFNSSTTNATSAFTAAQSGAFNDPTTWTNRVVPYGDFSINIPAGITVTIGLPALEINMVLCTILGTLTVGNPNTNGFTFNFPTTIFVDDGGTLQIQSKDQTLYLQENSVIYKRGANSRILPTNFVVVQINAAGRRRRQTQGNRITSFPSTGRGTIASVPSTNGGGFVTFDQPTFVGTRGGDAQDPTAYCGNQVAPSTSSCGTSCGIYVARNCPLTTASFNGVVTLPITVVTVVVGGTLTLGTPGSSVGFSFTAVVTIQTFGLVQFGGNGGGIRLPVGSTFDVLSGGSFTSPQNTFIQFYNPATNANYGSPVTLLTVVSGPYYVAVLANGTIYNGSTDPGVNGFGNQTSTTAGGGSGITTVTLPAGGGGSGIITVTLPAGGGGSGITTVTPSAVPVLTTSAASTSSTTSTTSTTTTSTTTTSTTTTSTTTTSTTTTSTTTTSTTTTSTTTTSTTTTAAITQALG